ncbi:MAG: winged helix-turn-helix transcriptional regulator [Ectothiorhodospiraceae bacterium]|jgi:DNA-binding HxlR family transcriptional regulator
MKTYGQFCPVAKAAEIFCERWTPLILRELAGGSTRFAELQRGIPLASPTVLSRRLRQLEAEGILERRRSPGGRKRTYHLTEAGREFIPVVEALGTWGQRWSRRELMEHEMDLDLLLWAMEKSVHPDALGDGRKIVQVDVIDQPRHKRRWWFLNENGHCELCVKEPTHDVDLYVSASLADLIYVWRGDLPIARALEAGRLRVHGPAGARQAIARWLGISTLAHIKTRRGPPAG